MSFDEDALQLVYGTNLYFAAMERRQAVEAAGRRVLTWLRRTFPDIAPQFSVGAYRRAVEAVLSRAVTSRLLTPGAAVYPKGQTQTESQEPKQQQPKQQQQEEEQQGSSLTSETAASGAAEAFPPLMLPLFDLLDHSHDANVVWRATEEGIELCTRDALVTGAGIFNNYGCKGNEELMLAYGFALGSNPHNDFNLLVSAPCLTVAGSAGDDDDSSSSSGGDSSADPLARMLPQPALAGALRALGTVTPKGLRLTLRASSVARDVTAFLSALHLVMHATAYPAHADADGAKAVAALSGQALLQVRATLAQACAVLASKLEQHQQLQRKCEHVVCDGGMADGDEDLAHQVHAAHTYLQGQAAVLRSALQCVHGKHVRALAKLSAASWRHVHADAKPATSPLSSTMATAFGTTMAVTATAEGTVTAEATATAAVKAPIAADASTTATVTAVAAAVVPASSSGPASAAAAVASEHAVSAAAAVAVRAAEATVADRQCIPCLTLDTLAALFPEADAMLQSVQGLEVEYAFALALLGCTHDGNPNARAVIAPFMPCSSSDSGDSGDIEGKDDIDSSSSSCGGDEQAKRAKLMPATHAGAAMLSEEDLAVLHDLSPLVAHMDGAFPRGIAPSLWLHALACVRSRIVDACVVSTGANAAIAVGQKGEDGVVGQAESQTGEEGQGQGQGQAQGQGQGQEAAVVGAVAIAQTTTEVTVQGDACGSTGAPGVSAGDACAAVFTAATRAVLLPRSHHTRLWAFGTAAVCMASTSAGGDDADVGADGGVSSSGQRVSLPVVAIQSLVDGSAAMDCGAVFPLPAVVVADTDASMWPELQHAYCEHTCAAV